MTGERGGAVLRLLGVLFLLALLAALISIGVVWRDYNRFVGSALAIPADGKTLMVQSGSSFRQIVKQLDDQKLTVAPEIYWRLLGRQMGVTRSLHAGEYVLERGVTPRDVLQKLADGDVLMHRFTIIEGWSFRELRQALDASDQVRHVTRNLDGAAIMQQIGAEGQHPEGRFLPETYLFPRGTTDLDVLKRAHDAMRKFLHQAWAERDKELPYENPYQALIMASIVEKETGRADERRRIAGVFVRRLDIGMALATDPTVIYGMGEEYNGNITRRDLRTDTPYNTYLRAGLPPTPIAMPGKAAIEAALHPADGKALYFVARDDGTGSHEFSATLAEHNRAVACYQRKRCR